MSLYELTIPAFKSTLGQVEIWLNAAVAHAEKKKFDPDLLLSARLAPDQYPLVRQIQACCDTARATAPRLTGREPPKHADTEQTMAEIRTRISTVITLLDTFRPAEFEGAESRLIALPFLGGKSLLGSDYVSQLQLPNFYFHAAHAYAILRHNGVPLGKAEFIGHLTLH